MISKHTILGIGAPIMDSLLRVSEEFITQLPGKRHGMQPIERVELVRLVDQSGQEPLTVAGGSAANTIRALAQLGYSTSLVGTVGRDALGEEFIKTIVQSGVKPLLKASDTPTARVLSLITPDGHRTCRAYRGASLELTEEDLSIDPFQAVRLVHIEGYALQNKGLIERALKLAQEVGAKVSFDLSSHEIVAAHRDRLITILPQVDIVIGNEDELYAFFGATLEEGCARLAEWCQIAVVLRGKAGCLVGTKQGVQKYAAYPVTAVDTTGAGDSLHRRIPTRLPSKSPYQNLGPLWCLARKCSGSSSRGQPLSQDLAEAPARN